MTVPPKPFSGNISFNAQHSPMGAFMSFSCGNFGTRGGVAAQIGKPGNQDLFVGIKPASRFDDVPLRCLPFFRSTAGGGAGAADFLVEQAGPSEQAAAPKAVAYGRQEIRRYYGWATDRWATDDFTFTVFTPFGEIPDPALATTTEMRHALMPAVVAELEVDNTRGAATKTAFFAMNFNEPGWLPLESGGPRRRGFTMRREYGVLGQVVGVSGAEKAESEAPALFCRWSPDQGLAELVPHGLGSCPGLVVEVPAGQRRVLRLAIGCYLGGTVTRGIEGQYLYTRYFSSLDDVLAAALDRGDPQPACDAIDRRLLGSGLSDDQQFLIAHATRSYYGSTQLLDVGGQPFWLVNEGEYCMMNTLDLSVDHVFWELSKNPWIVRNLLDNFVRHYSYVDGLKADRRGARTLSGGLSFTHDMGAHNNFTPHGHSSYELPELDAVCFSYMTAEQLCNWVLMAATYVTESGDADWARQNEHVLLACFNSLLARGGESGVPEYDSTRCGAAGSEITTYDSLDHSLAQTRNNLYMAVKFWAAAMGLATLFDRLGAGWRERRSEALAAAGRAERTVLGHVGSDGVIPAVFEPDNAGYRSRILPACEGLIYPYVWGVDVAAEAPGLHAALKRHTLALLKDPQQRNLFPDGGIKLSSTSDNSWMSKIAIFQHIARKVLHVDEDPPMAHLMARADAAHVAWQTDGSGYWACSDQFVSGKAMGSRYYPRIITTALWMP
jgi:xylan 1,4-beta-xylosidase